MTSAQTSSYAHWRARHGFAAQLQDAGPAPPEQLLQAIWQHQRLRRGQLVTLDDQPVRVLHPGFGNVEGGPDFRDAMIQIGSEPARSGDVEIDLSPGGWRAHGHEQNPAFRKVILHVVWQAERGPSKLPTLAVREWLDAPVGELAQQLEHNSVRALSEEFLGKCSAPLSALSEDSTLELLREAAHVRRQNKAAQFCARARHAGWDQALWEGLFRALGYKHNTWAMQQLAEHRPRWHHEPESPMRRQARLLGLSGLLPKELSRQRGGTDDYLQQVWHSWWRERDAFADCTLPAQLWRFHGLRPANHPQRRLALAAHWTCDGGFIPRIEEWCRTPIPNRELLASLLRILQVKHDDYWSWHWTFRSPRLAKPQPLIGETRVTDLAVNVIGPWLWARAQSGGNEELMRAIEQRLELWPAAEDNAILRLARQRLLGRANLQRSVFRQAIYQQGLLQIVRDFCEHAPATCAGCGFPELVRSRELLWSGAAR